MKKESQFGEAFHHKWKSFSGDTHYNVSPALKKRRWFRFYAVAFVMAGTFAIIATTIRLCYNGELTLPSWLTYSYYKNGVASYYKRELAHYRNKLTVAFLATLKSDEKMATPKAVEKTDPLNAIAVTAVETVPASKPTEKPATPKVAETAVAKTPTTTATASAPATPAISVRLAKKEEPPKSEVVPSLAMSPMVAINLDSPPIGFGIPAVPTTPPIPKTVTVNKPGTIKEKSATSEPTRKPAVKVVLNEPKPMPSRQVNVNLSEQEITVTEKGSVIFRSTCSSGRPTMPTPSNVTTTITSKSAERRSREYNSPMPWFVDIGLKDGDGEGRAIGIHEGAVRGYPASHKCIRLPKGKAHEFYDLVSIGTPVHIEGNAWNYLQRKFPGYKLLDFDNEGKLIGFKRSPSGGVPKEFLDYVNGGGKIDICSLKPNGEIAVPPLKEKSAWYLMFGFMDNPRKQGFSVTRFEEQTGIPVSFNR